MIVFEEVERSVAGITLMQDAEVRDKVGSAILQLLAEEPDTRNLALLERAVSSLFTAGRHGTARELVTAAAPNTSALEDVKAEAEGEFYLRLLTLCNSLALGALQLKYADAWIARIEARQGSGSIRLVQPLIFRAGVIVEEPQAANEADLRRALAILDASASQEVGQRVTCYLSLSSVFRARGQLPVAIAWLEKAAAVPGLSREDSIPVRMNLARAQFDSEDRDVAIMTARECEGDAIAVHGARSAIAAGATMDLAEMQVEAGKLEEARNTLLRVSQTETLVPRHTRRLRQLQALIASDS